MKNSKSVLTALLIAGTALLNLQAPAAQNNAEPKLDYAVSWLGNSFSGANDKWAQNFFIHMNVRPDGSCVTWSRPRE
ncbi:MAG: hypothetical protein K9N52_02325 [Verrucomicrobia bacterium]|nr:hypothetical protein [Verrucomicrobiota bacterium]